MWGTKCFKREIDNHINVRRIQEVMLPYTLKYKGGWMNVQHVKRWWR